MSLSQTPPGNPFAAPGQWYRGNLHTHTTESDGARAPEAALAWYAAHGYDFVSITNHDRITRAAVPDGSLLTLPGAELSLGRIRQGASLHCVAVGLAAQTVPDRVPGPAAGWVALPCAPE
ncbi:MAG: PHP domain-containing protein [Chloroflexi bacterium]|nr:PHP domain-containing protein [Chloroflexota bacterium]